jgi:hypothetical protein
MSAILKILITSSILLVASIQAYSQFNRVDFEVFYGQVAYPFYNYDLNKNGFSYRIGGIVCSNVSNRFSIGTGINFEEKRYSVNYSIQDSPSARLNRKTYSFSYVSFPLLFELEFLNIRSHILSIRSGFELDRLLEYEIYKYYSDGTSDSNLDGYIVQYNNTSFLLGPSYRYLFNNNMYLGINAAYRYNLTKQEATTSSFLFQVLFGYKLKFNDHSNI